MQRIFCFKFLSGVLAVSIVFGGYTMSAMSAPVPQADLENIQGGAQYFKCPQLNDGSMACAMTGTGCISCAEFTQLETIIFVVDFRQKNNARDPDFVAGWTDAQVWFDPVPPKNLLD